MKMNPTCLIFSSCLILQTVPMNRIPAQGRSFSLGSEASAASGEIAKVGPLFGDSHAKELLEKEELIGTSASSEDLSTYIFEKTESLLPEDWKPQAKPIARALIEAANQNRLDPVFLMALILQESRFNPSAKGRHGEIGLVQIKPTTAQWMLERKYGNAPSIAEMKSMLAQPVSNIRFGASYIAYLRERFNGQKHLYISAYNMGASRVNSIVQRGVVPRIYSDKVLAFYLELLASQNKVTDSLVAKRVAQANPFATTTRIQ